ncbi:MAG: hypothetical protein GF375_00315 [Candidatus Omnitrophica bacterium]|nr:hypothetical protein [Candidatus Omnitrophota bacterium]MBD3268609.1 hypothetical protein [Candidatus Omnitrophota bacterium]
MRNLIIFLSVFFFSACATTPGRFPGRSYEAGGYVSLEDFCLKNGFRWGFDTLDDVVNLYSEQKEIKILLNSSLVLLNNSPFSLRNKSLYHRGEIMLPSGLKDLIAQQELKFFKPAFRIKTVVVDPGHGGKDPGAVSPWGVKEKDINLRVSRFLKSELERQGYRVVLTRDRDVYLTLRERVNIAKHYDADFFISVHANANTSRKVRGVEIYYLTPSRLNSMERASKLARLEDFYDKRLPHDIKTILWDILLTRNHSLSVEMSNLLYSTFKNLGFTVKSPRKAPFYVLRFAYVPSVLVEIGYLTNYYEQKTLRKQYYQKQISQGIAMALEELDKRYTDRQNVKKY